MAHALLHIKDSFVWTPRRRRNPRLLWYAAPMLLQVPCPQCGKVPPPPCDCPPLPPGPPDPPSEELKPKPRREIVKLRREKRRGRPVIVIDGLPDDVDVTEYSKALKQRCACGGTVKGRSIEVQGDHREAIEAFLHQRGFKTKRAGG